MDANQVHAGQVVDLKTWGRELPHVMTKVIAKTNEMEIQEVNLKAGEVFFRITPGPLVAQCLTGEIELAAPGTTNRLLACQLLHLKANEPHYIRAISDSTVLLILIYQSSGPASTTP